MAQHLAQRGVLVGQLLDPVVIGIQPQPQGTQHQDRPLRHTGTASVGTGEAVAARPFGQHLGQDGKDPLPHGGLGVEVLESPQ